MSNNYHSAGDLLSDWLVKNGFSQREFSRRTGITQAMLSKVLSKQLFISAKTALVIEKETGISARVLLESDIEERIKQAKRLIEG